MRTETIPDTRPPSVKGSVLAPRRRPSGSLIACVLALVLLTLMPGGAPVPAEVEAGRPSEVVERRLEAMGTELRLRVVAPDRPGALAASEAAVRSLRETELRLSTWIPDSELARLNRAAVGERLPLSPELGEDLAVAARMHEVTHGRFDPTVGSLVRAWGLRTGGAEPTDEELGRALARTGWSGLVELDGTVLQKRVEVVLDEGGFGKGVGLDRALRAARAAGAHAIELDLGGQVLVSGTSGVYGVAHPDDRHRPILETRLDDGSLATSGNGERGILVAGKRLGHLLDPATGRPAPDWGSVTVLAPSAGEADSLSTGLYVLGPGPALAFAARTPGVEVLVLERDGESLRARASAGLEGRVRYLPGAPVHLSFVKPGAGIGPEERGDGEQHAAKAHGSPPRIPSSISVAAEARIDEREYIDVP